MRENSVQIRKKSGFTGERAIIIPNQVLADWQSDALGRLLRITDIGYYPHAQSHYRRRAENEIMQYILIYCVSGEGDVVIGGHKYKIQPNQLIIIPRGAEHSYGSRISQPWSIYWIHFDGDMAGYFSEGLDKPLTISPGSDSRIETRIDMFEEIYSTLRNGYSPSNLSYSLTVLFHFFGSLKYVDSFRGCGHQDVDTGLVERTVHYMRENIHRQLTLSEIAEYNQLSVSHFTALFHHRTGFSPINYFLQLKIQQACYHLDFTDMKVNQVSSVLGFHDPLYFSRVFSRFMGSSPSQYRKKKKG